VVAGGGTAGALIVANRHNASGPTHVQAQVGAKPPAVTPEAEQAQLVSNLTFSPAPGTTGVPLNTPVSVKAAVGFLTQVKVTAASGAELTGTEAPGTNVWNGAAPLLPSTTYNVSATVLGQGGVTAQQTASFTTLTPVAVVTASVYPTSDMTVGVGQPIVVHFNHDITTATAQQAVESHFTVAESQPVPGGWYWFSPYELHFRPETYWPAHEQIQVTGDLNGWDAGAGRWGGGQISDTFSVGDARISYANLDTEVMKVTLNGATVATYPISGGRPQYPTMDGDHIVMDKESVVHMVSSTVGIPVNSPNGYDEYVYDDVHISDSGEYVHAAPWSVGSQGVTNVSHGCINVSPSNALSFYNFSQIGDVVEVTGSPRPAVPGDHGVMDWGTPWSQWAPGNVVALNPPAASSPPGSGSLSTTTLPPTTVTTKPTL
jgi:lipoprotein-anchoring transpeptidase ErfK/SrfK